MSTRTVVGDEPKLRTSMALPSWQPLNAAPWFWLMCVTVLLVIEPEAPSKRMPRRRSAPASQASARPLAATLRLVTLATAPPFWTTPPTKWNGAVEGSTAVMVWPAPSSVSPLGAETLCVTVQSALSVMVLDLALVLKEHCACAVSDAAAVRQSRSEEHTPELQSRF